MVSPAFIKGFPKFLFRKHRDLVHVLVHDRNFKLFMSIFRNTDLSQADLQSELDSFRRATSLVNENFTKCRVSNLSEFINEQFPMPEKYVKSAKNLQSLFNYYGSDKARNNDLHRIYAPILLEIASAKKYENVSILEIGLGTNFLDIPSNMSLLGSPGASVRAFRDFLEGFCTPRVFGADVDVRVLFSEPGIQTFFVNQLEISTLQVLGAKLGKLDLIIDDGLHSSEANINTMLSLLPHLSEGGFYITEDISNLPENFLFWEVINSNLDSAFSGALLRTSSSVINVIQRSTS